MNPSVMGASGEMISTRRNPDRFFAALLGGRLLPKVRFRAGLAGRTVRGPCV